MTKVSEKKNFSQKSNFSERFDIKGISSPTDGQMFVKGWRLKKAPSASENGKSVLCLIKKVIHCHFPELGEKLRKIKDPRNRREYSFEEMLMAGMMLFLFKQKSRNEMDNNRRDREFSKNYYRAFKLQCPSMDAVEDLFRELEPSLLEDLKASLIGPLIEKRVLHRFRLLGKWFLVAVDGTGVYSSTTEHWEEHVQKTSKKGVVTNMNPVLEAKLVTSNGLCLSLCSEWCTNKAEYDKQDCELKAFKRIAVRLKKYFPRLPICLVVDGLYCNQPVMDICEEYGWQWIIVFKDGNLPTVHKELKLLPGNAFNGYTKTLAHKSTTMKYQWCNDIIYKDKTVVHWIECQQKTINTKGGVTEYHFEYLTNISQNEDIVAECVSGARKRWNIEESFNDQKNRDFEMQHLFSRVSFKSFCNWYQTLQLAYNIYIFVVKCEDFEQLLKQHSKQTMRHLWQNLIAIMTLSILNMEDFEQWIEKPRQVRLC